MQLMTLARNCLALNWALPLEVAPALPPPLQYEVHRFAGADHVFASALLFHLSGLHYKALPFLRLGYPQLSFRLYVMDHHRLPAVLLQRTLVPAWIKPVASLLGRHPTEAARLVFPPPQSFPGESWHWSVERGLRLEVDAHVSSPQLTNGMRLGSWEETVAYFRHRRRAYAVWHGRLRALDTSHPPAEVVPLEVDLQDAGLIAECCHGVDEQDLRFPHSTWLSPEIPFSFELSKPLRLPLAPQAGQPWPAPEGC